MSGFHVLTPSWTAGSTATSNSTAAADLTAANLLRVQPSWFYRSAGLTVGADPIRITIDAGEAKPWDTVALLYNNGYTGTIRIKSNNSTGTLYSSPSYDSNSAGTFNLAFPGDLSGFPDRQTWVHVPTIQTHRYIGIEISDTDNPDGYFEAGVVMSGILFTPTRGADIGSGIGYDDPSVAVELVSGETIVRPKRSKAVGRFLLPNQTREDAEVWRHLNYVYGSKIPVIFKWDPLDTLLYQQGRLIYGFMSFRSGGAVIYSHATGNTPGGLHDVEVSIREV